MSRSPRVLVTGAGSSPLGVAASVVLMAGMATAAMWAVRRHRARQVLDPEEDLTPVVLAVPAEA